jgi:hypothetical protein
MVLSSSTESLFLAASTYRWLSSFFCFEAQMLVHILLLSSGKRLLKRALNEAGKTVACGTCPQRECAVNLWPDP